MTPANALTASPDFRAVRAAALDGDGTLWRGNAPLPGLREFAAFMQARGLPWVVLTNNATRAREDYARKLAGMGVMVSAEQILTAGDATAAYLARTWPQGGRAFVIGEPALRAAVTRAGFTLVPDATTPADVVVVGGDSGLTYARLKDAALHVQRGARLIGTNPDVVYPTEEGLAPETGTTLAALTAATGATALVIGKPERPLFDLALEALHTPAHACLMVGDRLETDIAGGQRAGMQTALVETGVDNAESAQRKNILPDGVFATLNDLVAAWRAAHR